MGRKKNSRGPRKPMKSDQKNNLKTVLSQQLPELVKLVRLKNGEGILKCVLCSSVKSKPSNMVKHIKEAHVNKYMKIMSELPELNQNQMDAHIGNTLTSFWQSGQPQKELSNQGIVKKEIVEGSVKKEIVEQGIVKQETVEQKLVKKEFMEDGILKKEMIEKAKKDFPEGLKCCMRTFLALKPFKNHMKLKHKEVWQGMENGSVDCWLEHCGQVGIKIDETINDMVLKEAGGGFKKEGVMNEEVDKEIKDEGDKINPILKKEKDEEKPNKIEVDNFEDPDDEDESDLEDDRLARVMSTSQKLLTLNMSSNMKKIIQMRKQEISKYWQGGSEKEMFKIMNKKTCNKKYKGQGRMCYVCGEVFRQAKPLKNHVKLNHHKAWRDAENGFTDLNNWKRVAHTLE